MPAALEETSKLTAKGQTTVPKAVRRALGLEVGDALAYRIEKGRVTVRKAKPEHVDPAVGKFLRLLEKDLAAGRNLRPLSPDLVAAMRAAVRIPVTVKCRIGVDDQDQEQSLYALVDAVAAAGCEVFAVHARKAWLQGLSPKENREVPPLDYELVARLKRDRPALTIIVNGGIATVDAAIAHLRRFDGVMIGRAAYGEPAILAEVDRRIFGDPAPDSEIGAVVREMSAYVKRSARQGTSPHHVVRHMLGLYHGKPGARLWRRMLSEQGAAAPPDILDRALEAMTRPAPADA